MEHFIIFIGVVIPFILLIDHGLLKQSEQTKKRRTGEKFYIHPKRGGKVLQYYIQTFDGDNIRVQKKSFDMIADGENFTLCKTPILGNHMRLLWTIGSEKYNDTTPNNRYGNYFLILFLIVISLSTAKILLKQRIQNRIFYPIWGFFIYGIILYIIFSDY